MPRKNDLRQTKALTPSHPCTSHLVKLYLPDIFHHNPKKLIIKLGIEWKGQFTEQIMFFKTKLNKNLITNH